MTAIEKIELEQKQKVTNGVNTEHNETHLSHDVTSCESQHSEILRQNNDRESDLEYGTVHSEPGSVHEDLRDLGEKLGDAHLNILDTKKLVVCLGALSLGLFITFVDQTGITVALAQIGKDLDAETTINWAGSAALLANCVCQVLFGRLSDIFGRKTILLSSLGILAVAEICCGFA